MAEVVPENNVSQLRSDPFSLPQGTATPDMKITLIFYFELFKKPLSFYINSGI
jgi:hypothetical protein